ncbi:nuclease-related domain-containing protein [Neobacillus sp. OS1-2]|uniref:nuclease-related domain-containing protein n=1 Tax=Neobacillus sp. OS1-2 TaxID=3070680 RepID=UPI0027E1DE7A|nr:nuclease-related domain-containing protein [Neobacillus sp. OS1-2]WML40810.1 nuclease-related domain-containing protein [Neobacillus sp. OS1-2]
MAYKPRFVPMDLLALRILDIRMKLSQEEHRYYLNKEKGFEGEVQFDLLTEQLQSDCLILNDLLLEVDNSSFQLDTTIIYQDTIFPFEVKNFEGDFIYKPDSLEATYGKEYKNPLDQLKRSKFSLGQLLKKLGYHFAIEGSVVFINSEFTLFQAPPNEPFIFPTQLNALMKKLNARPSKLTNKHKMLADKLVSLHQTKSSYTKLPAYNYGKLRKGFTCAKCKSFNVSNPDGERKIVCTTCGNVESIEAVVLRNVKEIKLLFPDMKITTTCVHEWCGAGVSMKAINRILTKNFRRVGHGKFSYYVND